MKTLVQPTFAIIAVISLVFAGTSPAEKKGEDVEATFSAMLANATLKGSWAPISGGALGGEKDDGYKIVSATKKEGDIWIIVYRVDFDGKTIDFPMPVTVKFAGDVAVLILDNVPTASGSTYSARVMFHNDVYAGSWWGKGEKGGTISGTISRDE